VLDRPRVVFHTVSGPLTVERSGAGFEMDFPGLLPTPVTIPGLAEALGVDCADTVQSRDAFVVLPDEAAVRAVRPDFAALGRLDVYAAGVTAPGTDVDFVSRFFAPRAGIDEDPVTGSAHCSLAPLWASRLGRDTLTARQVSARGGEVGCTVQGDRVLLRGQAVVVIEGKLRLAL
jgi:predicted PhzF superfamily epimerase YddE/YHI9